jgi:redox-sensitive bicupin YhaK (pirin superfamily)
VKAGCLYPSISTTARVYSRRAPWYRYIQSAEIPELTTPEGVEVRVIAGRSRGVECARCSAR